MYFQCQTYIMKKSFLVLIISLLCVGFISCSSKKETPASIAKKWCELNKKMHEAADGGPQYERAKEAFAKFREDMFKKYYKDEEFIGQVDAEILKCKDASEGR